MSGQPVLRVSNITKTFGWRKKVCIVDNVSFDVDKGEIVAFLGPNGAGKTTTAKMASGLIIPDKGSILINGQDPHREPDILRSVGTVLEGNRNLFWRLTAAENLKYFAVLKKKKFREIPQRVDEILAKFDLLDKKDVQVRKLSRGMQQRLAIAKCWLHNPRLIILDEPALGLDIYSRNELLERIVELKENGVAIIITTHNFDIAEKIADRIMIIDKGKIVRSDTTAKLLDDFSSKQYVVELDGKLNTDQVKRLMDKFNIVYEENRLVLSEEFIQLGEIIPEIEPATIHSLKRKNVELSDIFQQVTRR